MKIIFLDVDGVINSMTFLKQNPGSCVDPKNMILLKKLVNESGAIVVLSSGWRLWFDDDMCPKDGDAKLLYDKFKEYEIEVNLKTPDLSTNEIRKKRTYSYIKGKEILAWLYEHKEITEFVVLDDLQLRDDYINSKLIKINPEMGLTSIDVKNALRMLNVK